MAVFTKGQKCFNCVLKILGQKSQMRFAALALECGEPLKEGGGGLPTLILYERMSTGVKQRNMPNKGRKGLRIRYYQCWETQHLRKVVKM